MNMKQRLTGAVLVLTACLSVALTAPVARADEPVNPPGITEEQPGELPLPIATEPSENVDLSTCSGGYGLAIDVTGETQKYEIFYTRSAGAPNVRLYSPGTDGCYSDGFVEFPQEFNSTSLKNKVYTGMTAEGYPDIAVMTFYVSSETAQGIWNLNILPTTETTECVIVKAELTPDWESLNCDYKTTPTKLIGWSLNGSNYTTQDVSRIIQANAEIPDINQLKGEPPEESNIEVTLFSKILPILIAAGVICGISTLAMYFMHRKKKTQMENEEREERIRNANHQMKLRKKREEAEMEKDVQMLYLSYEKEFGDEYANDYTDGGFEEKQDIAKEEEPVKNISEESAPKSNDTAESDDHIASSSCVGEVARLSQEPAKIKFPEAESAIKTGQNSPETQPEKVDTKRIRSVPQKEVENNGFERMPAMRPVRNIPKSCLVDGDDDDFF